MSGRFDTAKTFTKEKAIELKDKAKENPKNTAVIITVIIIVILVLVICVLSYFLHDALNPKLGNYTFTKNKNHDGDTIFSVFDKTTSQDIAKKMCNAHPDCMGYNTNLEFKAKIDKDPTKLIDYELSDPEKGLYIKS